MNHKSANLIKQTYYFRQIDIIMRYLTTGTYQSQVHILSMTIRAVEQSRYHGKDPTTMTEPQTPKGKYL